MLLLDLVVDTEAGQELSRKALSFCIGLNVEQVQFLQWRKAEIRPLALKKDTRTKIRIS